jgi:signal transduction histidine kinase
MVRKAFFAGLLAVVPPILVLRLNPGATWPALASTLPGLGAIVFTAHSWARQTRNLTRFVNRLLDSDTARGPLPDNGDEVGELASALTDIGPQIDDLVHRLRTELTRREAILASMSEGVIAVDARLNVTFCNRAFMHAVGEPNIVEGAALIKTVRDPQLFEILKEVIASGETVRRRLRLATYDGPSFDVNEAAPGVYVWGHRIRFEQAIVNLIDNAVKFNRPNGEVRVQVRMKSKEAAEISISDTGIGIPRQDLDRIFERFYRVDKARSRQQGGTGLGLSIVKHAVQQMNGSVTVESELGIGSTFRITVPVCAAPARVS